jgi:isoaspartyl peptidase/L-asparaginase-like protein (Ntn-hydrolase superfamily)
MTASRRDFLRGAAAATMLPAACARRPAAGERPIVIATWDHGLALCAAAQRVLATGGDLLDALEQGVNVVEDDPAVHTVGFNGFPNEDGVVQLDAAIMDGRTHRAGAVAALERIKNPISVARKVMERTEHALLVGAGASAFARKLGFVEQELMTPELRKEWERGDHARFWRDGERHDTVCAIGMDAAGNLATAVSTSGLADKLAGRVGDSAIIGAGSYCDNEIGAAAATGIGELAICNSASFAIVERIRAGVDPTRACEEILARVIAKRPELQTDRAAVLAFIAMSKAGVVGGAALPQQQRSFRYAIARGLTIPPVLTPL